MVICPYEKSVLPTHPSWEGCCSQGCVVGIFNWLHLAYHLDIELIHPSDPEYII